MGQKRRRLELRFRSAGRGGGDKAEVPLKIGFASKLSRVFDEYEKAQSQRECAERARDGDPEREGDVRFKFLAQGQVAYLSREQTPQSALLRDGHVIQVFGVDPTTPSRKNPKDKSTEGTDAASLDFVLVCRTEGNRCYADGKYCEAALWYTKGIQKTPRDHVLCSNRSGAYLKLAQADGSVDTKSKYLTKAYRDAVWCTFVNPDWWRGYYRKGCVEQHIGLHQEAMKTLTKALSRSPPEGSEVPEMLAELGKPGPHPLSNAEEIIAMGFGDGGTVDNPILLRRELKWLMEQGDEGSFAKEAGQGGFAPKARDVGQEAMSFGEARLVEARSYAQGVYKQLQAQRQRVNALYQQCLASSEHGALPMALLGPLKELEKFDLDGLNVVLQESSPGSSGGAELERVEDEVCSVTRSAMSSVLRMSECIPRDFTDNQKSNDKLKSFDTLKFNDTLRSNDTRKFNDADSKSNDPLLREEKEDEVGDGDGVAQEDGVVPGGLVASEKDKQAVAASDLGARPGPDALTTMGRDSPEHLDLPGTGCEADSLAPVHETGSRTEAVSDTSQKQPSGSRCEADSLTPVHGTGSGTEGEGPGTEKATSSSEALEKSSEALEKSSEASENSPKAVEKSSEASEKSSEAAEKRSEASEKSSEALEKSPEAVKKSSEALEKSSETQKASWVTAEKSPGTQGKSFMTPGKSSEISQAGAERPPPSSKALAHESASILPSPPLAAACRWATWALGLSESRRHDWLRDCFRLRESEDLWGPNAHFHRHHCTRLGVLPLLIFCKLAQRKRAVPPHWDWGSFLTRVAGGRRPAILNKASMEAVLEDHGEAAVGPAARGADDVSMVAVAQYIYGCSTGDAWPSATLMLRDDIEEGFYNWLKKRKNYIFRNVGGLEPWRALQNKDHVDWCGCEDWWQDDMSACLGSTFIAPKNVSTS